MYTAFFSLKSNKKKTSYELHIKLGKTFGNDVIILQYEGQYNESDTVRMAFYNPLSDFWCCHIQGAPQKRNL